MTDVAVVGAGIFPFGRHDGVSALAMGAAAVRAALADAGLDWRDVQFAYGGFGSKPCVVHVHSVPRLVSSTRSTPPPHKPHRSRSGKCGVAQSRQRPATRRAAPSTNSTGLS